MIRKLIATAALALGLGGAALATPAEAAGFHGFGGGFHGGGFHGFGGGLRPGFGGGFRPGFGGFRGGFHNRGWGWGAYGAGLALAPFAYAGAYPYYDTGYPYGYDECVLQRRWVWNGYRRVLGYVRVCY